MKVSTVIPFPKAARQPAPVQDAAGEARAYHLGLLSEAGLAAREALADIYRATRTHYRGKALGEADATLSSETLGSLASATIRMIDLRGRNSDLELRRALTRWLDDNGGNTLTRFRVHFEDGEKINVTAADAGRLLDGIEHNAFPEIRR